MTGASSGLGYELALQLALRYGSNLILVARREDRLLELKERLRSESPVKVITLKADLSCMKDVEQVIGTALAQDGLYGAILNAGITYFGEQTEMDWARCETIMATNIGGTVRIAHEMAKHFEAENKEGGLMVISSMAALLPTPYQAVYSGTKAFMLNFIQALSHEMKNKDFSFTVFLPGGMTTEMTDNDRFSPLKRWMMPVEEAATKALEAFQKRKKVYIPGATNRLGAYASGILPKSIIIKGMAKTYLKALRQANDK